MSTGSHSILNHARQTGRDYISWSQITTYQTCPLKWWFAYVEQADREIVSAALLFGAATHAAIEEHLERRLAMDTPATIEQLMEVWQNCWNAESERADDVHFTGSDTYESLKAKAEQVLQTFLESEHAWTTGRILGIEETITVRLAEDLPPLLCRVDMIEETDDEVIVTDYKTVRGMWSEDTAEDEGEQLVLYGRAVQPFARTLDKKLRLQFVLLTKTKEPKIDTREVGTCPDRVQRSTEIARSVFNAMQSGNVYPSPSRMNCASCPYRKRCSAWHREQAE